MYVSFSRHEVRILYRNESFCLVNLEKLADKERIVDITMHKVYIPIM